MTANAELDDLTLSLDEPQGDVVIGEVHRFLGRFVAFPSEHAHVAVALWVGHAHLIERWESTPRLAFLSAEPSSGKTRALEIIELLVPRPVSAVNVSPAYLFRRVASEDGLPTILFDEIDTVFGPKAKEHEELRAFLNAGHRKGASAGRCVVRGNVVMTEELPAYCAVAVAGLGWLPETILSRSVIIRMRRRHAGEVVEPYRRRQHAPQGARVYKKIEAWARSQPTVICDWPVMPEQIQDRAADVWEALLAVADAAGGDWPKRARRAAVALVAESRETEPSLGVRLLADLRVVFGDQDVMSSKSILASLQALEESPWSDMKGKPLDERGLAHRLRQYNVKSKNVRMGASTPKGYAKADFYDVWLRYLPSSPEKSATAATHATTIESQSLSVADNSAAVADVAHVVALDLDGKPNDFNDVALVADVAHLAANGHSPAICAQCGDADDGKLLNFDGVYLHKECRRFWELRR